MIGSNHQLFTFSTHFLSLKIKEGAFDYTVTTKTNIDLILDALFVGMPVTIYAKYNPDGAYSFSSTVISNDKILYAIDFFINRGYIIKNSCNKDLKGKSYTNLTDKMKRLIEDSKINLVIIKEGSNIEIPFISNMIDSII